MNDKKRYLNEERAIQTREHEPPFAMYTPGSREWMAPRLTLPGKPPHRICTGVVR